MTRFWITLEEACQFVASSINKMQGGEIFVPKIKSLKITDLAKTLNPKAKIKYIGIRPGEKINEILVTEEESKHTKGHSSYFVIEPEFPFWKSSRLTSSISYKFYASDINNNWLTSSEIKQIINEN